MSEDYTRIQIRKGTSTQFNTHDPVLARGEPAIATDTNTLKIGDGTKTWSELSPIGTGGSSVEQTANHFSLGAGPYSNWQPSEVADVLRVTTTADVIIHGLDQSHVSKKQITINNFGTFTMTLKQDSPTATAENRFYNMPQGDIVLNSGDSATLTYDNVYSRWLVYGVGQATKILSLTQAEYDALSSYDPNTLYIVT